MMIMNLKDLQGLLTSTQQGRNQKHAAPGEIMVEGPLVDDYDGTDKRRRDVNGGGARFYSSTVDTLSTQESANTLCISVTSSLTSSVTSQQRPARHVHFDNKVHQRTIACVNDYSREEIERTWFLPEESFQIHQRCIKEIMMLEKGIKLKGKKYCARGLENSTSQAQLAKKQNRRDAYDAVLDEQEEQYENDDDYDDEAIAELYHEVAFSCHMWAHVVGMQDQRAAELIYDEEDEEKALKLAMLKCTTE
jgi:hypothetical protein